MNESLGPSPSLPLYGLLPSMVLYAVLIGVAVAKTPGRSAQFLLIAISVRLAMSAVPSFSIAPSPFGLSWNAVASLLIVSVGAMILPRGPAVSLIFPPVGLLIFGIAASGIVNKDSAGLEIAVRYVYFVTIALLTYDALRSSEPSMILGRMLMTFVLPYMLQIESLILGIRKASEGDGSASYIGGYNHEAGFAVILVSSILLVALNQRLRLITQVVLLALGVIGVVLANYRTAIIAMAPLLAGIFFTTTIGSVLPRQRMAAFGGALLALLAIAPLVISASESRFEELSRISEIPHIVGQRPTEFREEDRKMFSGRLYLWSEYLTAWRDGSDRQKVVGFGANSWTRQFQIYAHNTLISTIYELGYFGLVAMVILWAWMLILALFSAGAYRLSLVTGHVGFILLNMATMPLWMIEGLMFYGLLCGATIFAYLDAKRPRVASAGAALAS